MSSTPIFFRILNPVMKAILHSSWHWLVSDKIMVITFKGIKSGKEYATPVSYFVEGGTVYCFTHGKWWKNLATGANVMLHIKGEDYPGFATVETEDIAQISTALQKMMINNPRDARYYGVTFDADGRPNMDEIRKAATEAVMIHIALTDVQAWAGEVPIPSNNRSIIEQG